MDPGSMTGLCAACGLSGECLHARALSRPIIQCEQFQFELPPPDIRDEPRAASSRVRRKAPLPEGAGLCAVCASSFHCTYLRPGRGAWLCEESA